MRPVALAIALVAMSCTETRDLGSTLPHGPLPVDERNPIVLVNDGAYDNWQGEYAILLANAGGPKLTGIIVNTSSPWPDMDANIAGWRALVTAAHASGLRGISLILLPPRASGRRSSVPQADRWTTRPRTVRKGLA